MAAAADPGLNSPDMPPPPGPPGNAPGPGPATLAGGPPGPEEPQMGQQGGGMSAMLGQATQTIMKTETQLTDMARQFPAAAPSLRQAVDGLRQAGVGLRAALRQVLTSPGAPEPPAPAIGG